MVAICVSYHKRKIKETGRAKKNRAGALLALESKQIQIIRRTGVDVKTVLRFGELKIHINWLIAVCVALTVALLVNLGFWQLGRLEDKQALRTAMQLRLEATPLALEQIEARALPLSEDEANRLENLRVTSSGRYWNEASFVVAFQFFQGAPGFELITPFEMAQSGETVLVSRGWVAPGPGADGMPFVVPIEGEQQLTGQLHVPPPSIGVTQVEGEAWPLRFRRLDIERATQVLERELLPWVVRLGPSETGVFARHWPAVTVSTRVHIQYALQWFAMATVILLISFLMSSNFLALRSKRARPE